MLILGQDPYHGFGQADGLSFSVNKEIKIPPSLKNIFLELRNDLNIPISRHGDLTVWAQQKILLLNSVLTVEQGKPNSHQGLGWEKLTDKIISYYSFVGDTIIDPFFGSGTTGLSCKKYNKPVSTFLKLIFISEK